MAKGMDGRAGPLDQTLNLQVDYDIATGTPLPAALPPFASGMGVLGFFGRRRKRKALAAA